MKKILNLLIYPLLLSVSITFAAPLEKVTLQLKWMHQFQFAGYYAAKEKGYYAAEGLDVDIFERSLDKDFIEQVVSGEKDFGVGDSGLLSYYARGEPIVALAAIFQHNPLVFIAKQSSGIISPYEMKGKRIMFDSKGMDDSVLQAVLLEARLAEKDYSTIKQSFRNDDLIEDKIDVMSGYLSDAIFYFQQNNIKINIINPQNYGIDFYGDILFTNQNELLKHPGRAEKFRRASLKGWQYALNHPEELIQLIAKKYHCRLSLAHLRFEADVTRKLILPDVIPLGQIDAGRMRKVAEIYAQLKLSKSLSERRLAQFINPFSHEDKPLIVGSEQDFLPLALGKTDDTADGFTVELWRAVAEEAHLNSRIRVLPWNQVLDEFNAEKIDVLINLAMSNERRQFTDFSIPHVVLNGAIFVRDDDQSIHAETDLNNKQIIVVNSDLAPEYLQEKGWDKQLVEVDTAEEGLKFLAAGQYDAMLLSKIVGKQTLEKLNINNVKMLPIDIGLSQRFAFAVHKGDTELLAKINEALAIIKANGTYDELYEKWFGIYKEKELLPLVIEYLAPIVIVFLLILVVIFYRHSVERKQSEKQLAQSERHLRAMFEASPECVKLVARDGTLLSMSQKGIALIEADSEKAVCNNCVYPIIAPEYRAAFQAFNEAVCNGKSGSMEFEIIGLKGTRRWMLTNAVPFNLENGDCVQLAFTQEITESKKIEERLHIISVAIEQSPTSIVISDLNGDLLYVNPKFTQVTGYSVEEAIGQNMRILESGLTADEVYEQLWDTLTQGEIWHGELINRRKSGTVYWEETHIAPVKNSAGVITQYVGVKLDITLRKLLEEKLQFLFDASPLGLALNDAETGNFIDCNDAMFRDTGYNKAEFLALSYWDLTPREYEKQEQQQLECLQQTGRYGPYEKEYRRKDGSRYPVRLNGMLMHDMNGHKLIWSIVEDITEQKKVETELRIAAIAFEAQEGITVTDENNRIIKVNKAFTEITGYTAEEMIGNTPKLLQSGCHDAAFYADLWKSIRNTGMWSGEIWNRRKNNEIYPQYMNITAVKNADGKVTNYVATFNDITLSRANADEIERLAFYDPLTNLPNRRLLHDRLKQALAASHRNHTSGGLLFIDMDNFKNLNDTLGHEMGDLLLRQVAERLLSCVRESDTVARLGGDEFVVLLEDLEYEMSEAAAQIEIIGKKTLLTLGELYQLNIHQYRSTPSIGAVLFNGYEQTPDELLKQADIAMYRVKEAGRNDLRFFNPQMQATIMAREALKKELHLAVVENQFRLYYQPQVYKNFDITGAEALIRWQHPERGLISPDVFIPLAEESDLILLIGNWVLETACTQLKIWAESEDTQHFQLAVNVSARQFSQPNFVSDVIHLINDRGINPTRLKLELTESMALNNLKETIDKMNTLREIGIRFSMDDFGTGHSSLSILKKLPIEQLKIDQSFVRDISTDSDDAVIVQTIIAMAKNLGLKIIAEGVETEKQCVFLEQHGCQHFQGYLFSKPVPIELFKKIILKYKSV